MPSFLHPVEPEAFKDTYRCPGSQLDFELQLRERFETKYPGEAQLLHSFLQNVHAIAGISSIRYERVDSLPERELSPIDEEGFLVVKVESVSVRLGHAPQGLQDTWPKTDREASEKHGDPYDYFKKSTHAMLVGVYSLLGASVYADSGWKGGGVKRRQVLRAGNYHNVPVFANEYYTKLRLPEHWEEPDVDQFWLYLEDGGSASRDLGFNRDLELVQKLKGRKKFPRLR